MTAETTVTAVLACHNRRDLTLACLAKLQRSAELAHVHLHFVLVDDGSTDGTAEAVQQRFPAAQVLRGSGDLFWNRGMHLGLAEAMRRPVDHLLWLNDDTHLEPDALRRMLAESAVLAQRCDRPVVMVGTTADERGEVTYGGAVSLSRLRRFSYRKVWHANAPVSCEVINGNCVLVPWDIAVQVGNIDPFYEHAMGDTDFALRVRRAGFEVFVASGIAAHCSANCRTRTFHDRALPLRERWRLMLGRKGLPWRSWLRFTSRHGGWLWPIYFAWPYVRVVLGRPQRF